MLVRKHFRIGVYRCDGCTVHLHLRSTRVVLEHLVKASAGRFFAAHKYIREWDRKLELKSMEKVEGHQSGHSPFLLAS